MRQISEAAKITGVVGKILKLIEKEELNDEQIESVLKATGETLGLQFVDISKENTEE